MNRDSKTEATTVSQELRLILISKPVRLWLDNRPVHLEIGSLEPGRSEANRCQQPKLRCLP